MRNPEAVAAMKEAGWEIASHGLKWIDYKDFSSDEERAHINEAIRIHTEVTGERPLGFYQGRTSEHTLRLVAEEGGFLYAADSYADELPYWVAGAKGPQLVVPYTLDANDMRFATPQGFNAGDQFYAYLKDTFDVLYAEGATAPKMMSVGLHCRLVGRPGRAAALARFLDYVASHEDVWVARRIEIARHWIRHHRPDGLKPSTMSPALFLELFGDVFEHTPWIAEHTYRGGFTAAQDTAEGLHAALVEVHRRGDAGAEAFAHPRPSGPRGTPEACRPHARLQAGAGVGRARQPLRGGAGPLPQAQRGLQGEIRLSLHHGREGTLEGRDPRRVRGAAGARTRSGIRDRDRRDREDHAPSAEGPPAVAMSCSR